MSLLLWIAITAIIAVGAFLQATLGFGMALLAAPLLALLDPSLIPGPMLLTSALLTLLMTRREWHAVRGRDLGWSLGGRVIGIVVALAVMDRISTNGMDLLFGAIVLGAVLMSAGGMSFRLTPGTLWHAGMVSGLMGTVTSIGGPPMALIYQNERGPEVRGTLSAYFLVGTILSVMGLAWAGRFGLLELRTGLMLCPGVILGYLASRRALGFMDRRGLRPAILAMAAASGLVVILRQLL